MSIRWHNFVNASAVIPFWAFVMVLLAVVVLMALSCPLAWRWPMTWEQESAMMVRGGKLLIAAAVLIGLGFLMLWWNWEVLSRGATSVTPAGTQQSPPRWQPTTASKRNAPAAALLTPSALTGRARQRVCRQAPPDRRAYGAKPRQSASFGIARDSHRKPVHLECLWA